MSQPPDGRASAPRDPLVGTVLDSRYQVLRRLGRGGMSTVYAARHLLLHKEVAVKVLRQELAHDQRVIDMIFREARTVASLGHPAIVSALDVGITPDGLAYIVLELLEGVPLSHEITRCRRIAAARAVRIAAQVASAMDAAHGAGVVHRDLKPENIYLLGAHGHAGANDTCKVLDFGVAKHTVRAIHGSTLTSYGGVVGTPGYMAPEQLLTPDRVDHRADVYSLGVVLYEMLVGRPPYHDVLGLPELISRVQQGRSPRIADAMPKIPSELAAIVDTAMAHAAGDRFQAMEELGRALRSYAVATGAFSDAPWLLVGGVTPPPVYVPSLRQSPPPPLPPSMAGDGAPQGGEGPDGPHGATPVTQPSAADLMSPPSPVAAGRDASSSAVAPVAIAGASESAANGGRSRRAWMAVAVVAALAGGALVARRLPRADLVELSASSNAAGAPVTQVKAPETQRKAPEAQVRVPDPVAPATEAAGAAPVAAMAVPQVRLIQPAPSTGIRGSRTRTAHARTASAPVASTTPAPAKEPVTATLVPAAPPPEVPGAPPTGPPLAVAPAPLAAAVIEKQVAAHRAAVDACIAEDPSVSGRLMLRVMVRADGSVESAKAESGASPAVRACLVKQVRTWRFPSGSRAEGRCAIELD